MLKRILMVLIFSINFSIFQISLSALSTKEKQLILLHNFSTYLNQSILSEAFERFTQYELLNIHSECLSQKETTKKKNTVNLFNELQLYDLCDKFFWKSSGQVFNSELKHDINDIDFDSMIKKHPGIYEIYEIAALFHLSALDFSAGKKYIERGLKAFPEYPKASLLKGMYCIITNEDVKTGQDLIQKTLESSNTANNYFFVGIMYNFLVKNKKVAQEYYTQAIELDPQNFLSYLTMAELAGYEYKEFDRAEEYYEYACMNSSFSNYPHFLYSTYLFEKKKDYVKAQNFLNITKDIGVPVNMYRVKLMQIDIYEYGFKDHKSAIIALDSLLNEDPNNLRNLTRYIKLQKYYPIKKNLEKRIRKAIQLNTSDSELHLELGKYYLNQDQDYIRAKEEFEKAIKIHREDPINYFEYANYFASEKIAKFSKAEDNYLKAINLDPEKKIFYDSLGMLYMDKLHKPEKAKENFLKAIEIDPKYPDAYLHLILLTKNIMKNQNEADKLIDDAIQKFPEDTRFKEIK